MEKEQFKEMRKKYNLTQRELANIASVSEDYISKIERGIEKVSENVIKALTKWQADKEIADNFKGVKTMKEVIEDADEKNRKVIGEALARYGNEFMKQNENIALAKMVQKSIIEKAAIEGISKSMIQAYCLTSVLEDFNYQVVLSAVKDF